jgi:hypothetical protein
MPLIKTTLAQELENIFNKKPGSAPQAALLWAKAYTGYAANAISKAGSLPVNAQANQGILIGAFTSAFNSMAAAAAAALMVQGIVAFWQAIAWTGPTAAGVTTVPGNLSLTAQLSVIFLDLDDKTSADKAQELADAFDAGAKMVIVSDIPYVQPAPPIVGPIS